VAGSGGDAPRDRSRSALESKPDEPSPPSSSSGIRARHGASLRRNTPPFRPLTPYQARLDVEMDDTAISKVRDPSVSLVLGDAELSPRRKKRSGLVEAAISVAAGVVLGALLVVLAVLALRALGS
jgi:hypothetical protein